MTLVCLPGLVWLLWLGLILLEQLTETQQAVSLTSYRAHGEIRNNIAWDSTLNSIFVYFVYLCLRDVTLFYKIKHGLVGIILALVLILADSRTRCQNTNKLRVVTSTCLTYQYSYFVRCVPVWNHLQCTSVGNRRPDSSTVPDGRLPNHQSPVMLHVGF